MREEPALGLVRVNDMSLKADEFQRLLEKVYRQRGFDFRGYRPSTLSRRLSRRLRARGARSYVEYRRVLDDDPDEYDKFFDALTINVSSFFRDEVAFRSLGETVVPQLIHGDGERNAGMRVWSAGCAKGQEPYSIAMIFLETLGSELSPRKAAIIGTDIDATALRYAREGVFGPKDVEGIRSEWVEKYFMSLNGGFRIKPAVKQLVRFEEHNLVSDLPYRDVDLVVCRNVLIYFSPDLQTRVFRHFHEGLKAGGYLLLGKAEVPIGETKSMFQCVDRRAKLYRKGGRPGERPSATVGQVKEDRLCCVAPVRKPSEEAVRKVVVIGASAGGIDAVRQVLSGLPRDLPAAVVVVQHLHPDRRTHLHQYLARHCPMRVCLAEDQMPIETGVVYVAVPGKHLYTDKKRLHLNSQAPVHYVRPSVDVLFASAAEAFGPNTIGVVLSGSGRDGARGCQEIKAKGGVAIAQDADSSRHWSMPRAAIERGGIDYVLPLGEIAGKIVALLSCG